MSIAQRLYEAGLITYMRTDSMNLSTLALGTTKEMVTRLYGADYSKVRNYHTRVKGAQEAHEAIRPTYVSNMDIEGTSTEKRLYNLIWKRTVACQMADAVVEKTEVEICGSKLEEKFIASGEQILFDGFLKVYIEGTDDEEDEVQGVLPRIGQGQVLRCESIEATEKYTQHPPRYSEASLVKKLEELGIGRPSTYASTVSTITTRGYIIKGDKPGTVHNTCTLTLREGEIRRTAKQEKIGAEKKKLLPENIGIVVTDFLAANFADILNYGFTAKVEESFDKVAKGRLAWDKVISDFYTPFHQEVEGSLQDREHTHAERLIGNDGHIIGDQHLFCKAGCEPSDPVSGRCSRREHPKTRTNSSSASARVSSSKLSLWKKLSSSSPSRVWSGSWTARRSSRPAAVLDPT